VSWRVTDSLTYLLYRSKKTTIHRTIFYRLRRQSETEGEFPIGGHLLHRDGFRNYVVHFMRVVIVFLFEKFEDAGVFDVVAVLCRRVFNARDHIAVTILHHGAVQLPGVGFGELEYELLFLEVPAVGSCLLGAVFVLIKSKYDLSVFSMQLNTTVEVLAAIIHVALLQHPFLVLVFDPAVFGTDQVDIGVTALLAIEGDGYRGGFRGSGCGRLVVVGTGEQYRKKKEGKKAHSVEIRAQKYTESSSHLVKQSDIKRSIVWPDGLTL
jgi:hypothetical protein